MHHARISADTPQMSANLMLAEWQSAKRTRTNAIEQALYMDGVAWCCESCDAALPTEGAWCADCEGAGSYAVYPERAA